VEISENIKINIDDLAMGGEGVGRMEGPSTSLRAGMAVFVPYSVPGDELKIRLTDAKKNFGRGKIIDIVKPSPDRVEPKCPLAKDCGGCQWQHISYTAQLRFKTKIIKETLERIGKLKSIKVNEIIGMREPWGFRNKIQYPISNAGRVMSNAKIVMGYYRQGTHEVVDIDNCPIEHPKLSRAAKIVKDVLNKLDYSVYNEDRRTGLFRHLRARIGFGTGEVLLTFITNEKAVPGSKELIKQVVERCKKDDINVVGICQNINPRQTNVIMGEKSWTLWGRDFIYDKLGDLKFKVSNESFYQVNPVMIKTLYDKALELSDVTKNDTVIDAYSGIGTVALWFARNAQFVYGIEEVKQAVYDAAENAELNKIDNCRFSIGKVERLLPELKQGDMVILDPPRGGCEEKVLKTIAKSSFKKVVYISCNPASLARDLAYLSNSGFEVSEVQPVDMFPHSFHIETVVRVSRNE